MGKFDDVYRFNRVFRLLIVLCPSLLEEEKEAFFRPAGRIDALQKKSGDFTVAKEILLAHALPGGGEGTAE